MIHNISQLILPHRLASITSLELVWDLRLGDPAGRRYIFIVDEWTNYDALINIICKYFPALRCLRIALRMRSFTTYTLQRNIEGWESNLLGPIDRMITLSLPLRKCEIAVPWGMYSAFLSRVEKDGTQEEVGEAGLEHRQWRRYRRHAAAVYWFDSNIKDDCEYWILQGY